EEVMLEDNTMPNWKARIALFAMVPVVVGGLWLFNMANRDTKPSTVVAISCSGFEAEAHQLFDKGDIAVLHGTFAPGDHVHLAIDFNGVGYSWELTGVLTTKPDVLGFGWSKTSTFTKSTQSKTATKPTFTTSHGKISGFARLEVDVDVTTGGDGAITINK